MGETLSTFGEPDTVCFVPPVKSRGSQVVVDSSSIDPHLVKPKDKQATIEGGQDEVDSPLVTSPPKTLGSQQDPTTENAKNPITKLKSTPPAPTDIEFDPSNTHMIAYGMNEYDAKFSCLTGAKDDAILISQAFIDEGLVPMKNSRCYFASEHSKECTLQGMKENMSEIVKHAGKNGLIIFFYAGHLEYLNKRPTLIPKDFHPDNDTTWLTAEVLSEWLHECGDQLAGVICILDCCYADSLSEELIDTDCYIATDAYVFVATRRNEPATELNLEDKPSSRSNSLFSLSLKYHGLKGIDRFMKHHGSLSKLPLSDITERCSKCCRALSTLRLNPQSKKTKKETMHPVLRTKTANRDHPRVTADGVIFTNPDNLSEPYFKEKDPEWRKTLHPESIKWLEQVEKNQLHWLNKQKLLHVPDILMAAVCCIAYSIGTIEQKQQQHADPRDKDMFLTAFNHIAETIKRVTQGEGTMAIVLTRCHLERSLVNYIISLQRGKYFTDIQEISELEDLWKQLSLK